MTLADFSAGDAVVTCQPALAFEYDATIQVTLTTAIRSAIATSGGGNLPFAEPYPGAAYVFAFRGLPMILLISALTSRGVSPNPRSPHTRKKVTPW